MRMKYFAGEKISTKFYDVNTKLVTTRIFVSNWKTWQKLFDLIFQKPKRLLIKIFRLKKTFNVIIFFLSRMLSKIVKNFNPLSNHHSLFKNSIRVSICHKDTREHNYKILLFRYLLLISGKSNAQRSAFGWSVSVHIFMNHRHENLIVKKLKIFQRINYFRESISIRLVQKSNRYKLGKKKL